MILNEISSLQVVSIMNIANVIFLSEFIFLLGKLFFKRFKDKKYFKNITDSLKYDLTEISTIFFSFLSVISMYFLYNHYLDNLDTVLSSLFLIGCLILLNIVVKIIDIVANYKSKFIKMFSLIILKGIDNFFLIIILTQTTAILASLIPVVDITRFFGTDIKRTTLINFPFFIMVAFLLLCNLGLILQYFIKKFDVKLRGYINDFFELFCFALLSFWIIFCCSISYNIFLILITGIIGTYLITKLSTYLTISKVNYTKKSSSSLRLLYPISNIISSSFWGILFMTGIIFISLNFGNFYGLAISCLAMISSRFLKYPLNLIYDNSESYRYVAKTINNIVLFYIFYETLEFVARRQIDINLFSINVILGLFLSFVLTMFNISKIIKLTKYMEMNKKSTYLFFRSALYIVLFCLCFYFIFPHINYEILASFVLGLIITTSLLSIIGENSTDIINNFFSNEIEVNKKVKISIIPLINQITTLFIIITILLLPIIKIGE